MSQVTELIKSDLFRYTGTSKFLSKKFMKTYFFDNGFKYLFWLRTCHSKNKLFKLVAIIQHKRLSTKFCIDIPRATKLGYGLYLGHGKCIVINASAVIGNNVNLSQFTTIGSVESNAATIGDGVYIGPGVSIIENVIIGNEVKIGAGAVVTKNVDSNSVVAGVPAKKINHCKYNDFVTKRFAIK
ncbi:serine O-acetyltransferase [Proteus sp. DFP240708]|uniref:serine O-acetyltransferase n=1 Tax=Proteus TaxID=583 RepID=UPI0018E4484C|nr:MULTISPECIES: serine acetyltransferase [Proteus]MBI6216191.1 serine acetyltransferase [Proteus vulgaris]